MTEFVAFGETCGLRADVRMAVQRHVERLGYTLALGVAQRGRLVKELLGVLPKYRKWALQAQELLFRVAHQFHQDVPLPSALAAKPSHDFFQLLLELLGLTCEDRGSAAARLRDAAMSARVFFALSAVWWHR